MWPQPWHLRQRVSSFLHFSAYCYALAGVCHLAVTRVLGFSGRSVWTSASARALHLPSIAVQGFCTYLGSRVLGYSGWVVQGRVRGSEGIGQSRDEAQEVK